MRFALGFFFLGASKWLLLIVLLSWGKGESKGFYWVHRVFWTVDKESGMTHWIRMCEMCH